MARPRLRDRIAALAAARADAGAVRVQRRVDRREGTRAVVDGRRLLNFCSNDYLGLAEHPEVRDALVAAAPLHGVGAAASAVVCGHHAIHARLEEALADWLGAQRALLFGSGYQANLGVLQALLGATAKDGEALCVQDRLNHASLIDGARLAGCALRRYPHADAEGAGRQLRASPDAPALIATDGVFSMDGDIAPLRELALLARAESALLYVDDAHGVGVLGREGAGSAAAAGLGRGDALQLVTFGKALGGQGAAVVGDAALIEHIAQHARAHVYTTAPSPALAAAMLASVAVARREQWRRAKLQALIARFRRGAGQLGLPLAESFTPIQPILLGDNAAALAASRVLEEAGIWVAAIRPPTVPQGQARLRVALSAAHGEEDIDMLLDALCLACAGAPKPIQPAHRLLAEG
ncbi:8-amino-7-oxononanoate synthase [Coralloluteibacterium stylophorae]|uniref:8-amino-7-oxononanoate synthase n=1 Tax=Coralloluteibacterium stylophorae TaxID=1776034 RepID=A0A8J8AY94_9GAMM|nr:8-amino-7-oxononanoate synthase [Coralloluteibacterium stylophorae]MBS7457141.1 8-amino-7-oxononanoate synthase [Coralloluteibacterium stylophorae]